MLGVAADLEKRLFAYGCAVAAVRTSENLDRLSAAMIHKQGDAGDRLRLPALGEGGVDGLLQRCLNGLFVRLRDRAEADDKQEKQAKHAAASHRSAPSYILITAVNIPVLSPVKILWASA